MLEEDFPASEVAEQVEPNKFLPQMDTVDELTFEDADSHAEPSQDLEFTPEENPPAELSD